MKWLSISSTFTFCKVNIVFINRNLQNTHQNVFYFFLSEMEAWKTSLMQIDNKKNDKLLDFMENLFYFIFYCTDCTADRSSVGGLRPSKSITISSAFFHIETYWSKMCKVFQIMPAGHGSQPFLTQRPPTVKYKMWRSSHPPQIVTSKCCIASILTWSRRWSKRSRAWIY